MKIDINTRVFLLVILSCVTCLAKDAGNNISRTLSPTLTNSGDVRYQSAITENAYQLEKFSLIRSNGDPEFRTYMDTESLISFNYSVICDDLSSEYLLTSSQKPTKVLTVPKFSFHISCSNSANGNGVLTSFTEIRNGSYVISGNFDIQLSSGVIGVAFIEFSLAQQSNHENETSVPIVKRHDVVVIRRLRPVDTIFRIVIYIVQILVLTGFGAELDLQVVKETLRKPVAPVIGFCCQYITMPLIAFGVAKLATEDTTVALGIFVAGCCPGGGNSNMYTYLLNGDLSLSITTISTVAALAMLPAWIYTLGVLFIEDKSVSIPFSSVAISLAVLLVPLSVGVFLRTKFPKIATKVKKTLTPVIIVSAVILITIGIYSNLFIFRLFEPQIVLAACLLPYIGYIIGGVVSTIFRQPWKRIKTIIIETGMQNASIAYILLTTSFMAPMGDLAAVAPVASAVMTPLPALLVTVCYLIYQKCRKKYELVNKNEDDLHDKKKMAETASDTGKEEGNNQEKEKLTSM